MLLLLFPLYPLFPMLRACGEAAEAAEAPQAATSLLSSAPRRLLLLPNAASWSLLPALLLPLPLGSGVGLAAAL